MILYLDVVTLVFIWVIRTFKFLVGKIWTVIQGPPYLYRTNVLYCLDCSLCSADLSMSDVRCSNSSKKIQFAQSIRC